MDYLFYDIFKEGKTLDDAPLALLRKESEFAWASTHSGETTRFFPSITDEENKAESIKQEVPWIKHGFSDAKVVPIGNFTSVSKLFHQEGKYLHCEPVQRLQPFATDPCVTWYAVIVARDASSYEAMFGERDALHCVRRWNGGIAEEVFDVVHPQQGKVLRLKANDRAEVKQYVEDIPSLSEGAAEVDILRAKSHMVWDIFF
ncbi:uncharacterized protein BO87DRAFT_389847 [Aspergillus neoniger CBS 115656]|uniref:Uncharacterized protein n=1 Tax=Aspergillus neoniger (strain CBS 115656) TaxID=1448310 RepID=A0A318YBG8_ASPNB|nr:hypothetical protein BO87DRAFT_389847 [Aspergillus neoniger CBS 115656]PYH30877.1 hypothetical protein BO87DRAFT_389847 [Aspergillus neoniger CBS 115656]